MGSRASCVKNDEIMNANPALAKGKDTSDKLRFPNVGNCGRNINKLTKGTSPDKIRSHFSNNNSSTHYTSTQHLRCGKFKEKSWTNIPLSGGDFYSKGSCLISRSTQINTTPNNQYMTVPYRMKFTTYKFPHQFGKYAVRNPCHSLGHAANSTLEYRTQGVLRSRPFSPSSTEICFKERCRCTPTLRQTLPKEVKSRASSYSNLRVNSACELGRSRHCENLNSRLASNNEANYCLPKISNSYDYSKLDGRWQGGKYNTTYKSAELNSIFPIRATFDQLGKNGRSMSVDRVTSQCVQPSRRPLKITSIIDNPTDPEKRQFTIITRDLNTLRQYFEKMAENAKICLQKQYSLEAP